MIYVTMASWRDQDSNKTGRTSLKQIIEATWLADQVASQKADGIVTGVSELIASGALRVGAQLPTVRDMAAALHVSPSTVMSAWHKLRADELIETHRRGGTIVRHTYRAGGGDNGFLASSARDGESLTRHHAAGRTRQKRVGETGDGTDWKTRDFSRASADPALQPDLGRALAAGLRVANLHGTERELIVGALERAVAPTWPFLPEAWMSAGGGTEGIVLALQAVTQPGDFVAIENPTSPRLRGILATLELRAMPVDCDEEGPLPQALSDVLAKTPSVKAFVYQPRAQMPTGRSVSERRRDALATVLTDAMAKISANASAEISTNASADTPAGTADLYVIEDDHLGSVTHTPLHSLAIHHPSRCVLVRAYCRAFGLDLRTSVIGGAHALIERIDAFRTNRLAMPSRILQGALAYLLTDADAVACLHTARDRYGERRAAFVEALATRGVIVPRATGLIVWLPVLDESQVIVNLATHGVIVAGGSGCYVDDNRRPHIRISISQLPDDLDTIDHFADMVASAIRNPALEEYD